ncbi:MAG: type I DNA topoisomerase [Thermodesulfobacteriota bacterium]
MTKPVIIVESPTKVKTIKKHTGNQYAVTATSGHLMDLPPNELGIDIEHDFAPRYVGIKGKQKIVKALKTAVGDATDIYLAPDPDREGEAIAFHTAEILKKKDRRFYRVLFHELTPKGIQKGLDSPQELDSNKYDSQQARRILDRLVGYQISPLLWQKVRNGLSAGRVQSVAVRIICDREREIFAFEPQEYWSITALLEGAKPPQFSAKLARYKGKKIAIGDEAAAQQATASISGQPFRIDKIIKKTIKRNPLPPFITSTLQQEAIKKLGFSAKKAMAVAQQLYEGITLGSGDQVGLITYMRTDSTRIAPEAAQEAMALVAKKFGADYAIDHPRFFANKNKAQDAHEAIRPTSVALEPDPIRQHLSPDQFKLYSLIWKRFVASQMSHALIDQKSISIAAGDYLFRASGSTVNFPGFMVLYQVTDEKSDPAGPKDELPELSENEILKLIQLDPRQHFTAPPPRFSEASLIKELEENGIGRPSTYATILTTIRDKGYVDIVNKYFHPTELGFIVNDLLMANFPDILDIAFTARLEDDLDRIESAQKQSSLLLKEFYEPFARKLEAAREGMLSIKGVGASTGLPCPRCGKELRIKIGKNGQFLACSGYPECTFSSNYTRSEKGAVSPAIPDQTVAEGRMCDKCGSPMVVRHGKYGDFLACSAYPDCKNTQSLNSVGQAANPIGVKCPEKACDGEIVEKKSKLGKIFYGCSRFPKCQFATWDKPVDIACPQCGAPVMVEKQTKKEGMIYQCLDKACAHRQKKE